MRRYEDLVSQASAYVKSNSVDSITIPIGPRLGDVVVEVKVSGHTDEYIMQCIKCYASESDSDSSSSF